MFFNKFTYPIMNSLWILISFLNINLFFFFFKKAKKLGVVKATNVVFWFVTQ